MPVERSESRRASRKSTVNDEDVEVKRARGEISCAECRRSPVDPVFVGDAPPSVQTPVCRTGDETSRFRFVLADTEQLHRKISEMSERIRQLEDSIALFQAGVSNERHPLLRDDLLTIKFGPEVRRTVDEEHTRETLAQSIDALGTLTVGDHGETKYYGRMGASESLFLASTRVNIPLDADSDSDDRDDISLPNELKNLDLTFPLAIVEDGYDSIMDQLEDQLPPQPRAWALCEAYIAHITWWHRPMKRDEIIDDILIPIYNSVKDESSRGRAGYRPSSPESRRCPHRLAVLFLVLATGALVDLTLPPCSPEAEKYYRLGRAALSLRSILDSPEIETVEAVALMAGYHSVCTRRYSVESAWTLASTAMKLAQSIGLHRDSRQWELSEKSVQRRRNMFWEMFMFETLHCIALGRPPSMTLSQIDCEFPCDDEEEVAENGDTMQGYSHFKLTFFKDIYFPIAEAMLSAKAPSYATVLDLDRRIRQMTLPPVKLYLRPDDDDYNNPALCMKSYMLSHFRSLS
ncbi:uncharacterized protein FIBRA_04743 [Fibroporia radiculosa]|uniref:Xylanolytic transcriptional activator regulatory domain-containing protein n=1 Tax=Fibroporia radiculosa TaxID=599839 RepID=J4H346_9APHY|nr:uncharacterized protein FIBRA_04743 [Fibroporia radiculosa]CCM02639.1 predicted protein [Fibroporia radiculosa]